MEVVASLFQGRTAAAQCGLFTHKSVPVIFEPPCINGICLSFKGKGKAVPLQAWSGPDGYRKLRFPDFMTTAQAFGTVSLTQRPPLPPGNTPGTHFC